jgi:hypothetical protein
MSIDSRHSLEGDDPCQKRVVFGVARPRKSDSIGGRVSDEKLFASNTNALTAAVRVDLSGMSGEPGQVSVEAFVLLSRPSQLMRVGNFFHENRGPFRCHGG